MRVSQVKFTNQQKMVISSENLQMAPTTKLCTSKTKMETTLLTKVECGVNPCSKLDIEGTHGAPSLKGIGDRDSSGFSHER